MMRLHERREKLCYYYLECDIAGGEGMPDHEDWIATADQFKKALGFNSDAEALAFVKKSIFISQEVRALTGGNSLKIDFLMSLLT
jgi:hypothetical protein